MPEVVFSEELAEGSSDLDEALEGEEEMAFCEGGFGLSIFPLRGGWGGSFSVVQCVSSESLPAGLAASEVGTLPGVAPSRPHVNEPLSWAWVLIPSSWIVSSKEDGPLGVLQPLDGAFMWAPDVEVHQGRSASAGEGHFFHAVVPSRQVSEDTPPTLAVVASMVQVAQLSAPSVSLDGLQSVSMALQVHSEGHDRMFQSAADWLISW